MKTTDFLTELSTDKLAQYKTVAAADASKADKEGDFKRGDKRFSGIVKATKKQFANDAKKDVAEEVESTVAENYETFKKSVADSRAENNKRFRELVALRAKKDATKKEEPKEKGVAEGAALPPEVIELIKKIAQSSATPEHKKAMIDALVAKHSKQGVAEGHDSEDLANEVYAEFERTYPNLARRADERTIHAAIMDVLNYGGDNNPGALAQDVARAVKQDMQQGVAEGFEWETRHDEFTTVGDRATPEQINKIVKALLGAAQQAGSKRGFLNQLVGKQSNGDLARMAHVAETLAKNIQKNSNAKLGSDERKELGQHLVYAVSLLKRISGEQGVAEGSLDEIDRRGFLKGMGAAAVAGAGSAAGSAMAFGIKKLYTVFGDGKYITQIEATSEKEAEQQIESNPKYKTSQYKVVRAVIASTNASNGGASTNASKDDDNTWTKIFAGTAVGMYLLRQWNLGPREGSIFKVFVNGKDVSNKLLTKPEAIEVIGNLVGKEHDIKTQFTIYNTKLEKIIFRKIWSDAGDYPGWIDTNESVNQGVAEGLLGSDPNRGQKVPDWAKRGIVGKIGQKLDTAWSDVQMTVPQHLLSKQSSVPATNSLATKNMPKATSITPTRAIPQSVGTKLSQPAKNVVKTIADKQDVAEEKCPHCNGPMFSEMIMNEKKDACYYKVKSRYKVWPSAYASGALVKCRNKGASNWGNSSKNESSILEGIEQADESLHDWFNKEKWVRMDTKGNIKGPCAKEPGEGKPKCLPQSKAHSLGKKGRASAAARKRREDPNPDRSGKAINVNTKKK